MCVCLSVTLVAYDIWKRLLGIQQFANGDDHKREHESMLSEMKILNIRTAFVRLRVP